MSPHPAFIDIHCHLIPGIDDGAQSWDDTLAMAQLAVQDGTRTIIATPHQLGAYSQNHGDTIRARVGELQQVLTENQIDLEVLAGGDVRIEDDMVERIMAGEVMTLADRGKHVLLELPHELYFPLEPILEALQRVGLRGILSHPERNAGLMSKPHLLAPLVNEGCLMQVTSGSLVGSFGPASQHVAESMLQQGWVHFLASDGHSPKSRRPLMGRGFRRASELVGVEMAELICCHNPRRVAEGKDVAPGPLTPKRPKSSFSGWFRKSRVA